MKLSRKHATPSSPWEALVNVESINDILYSDAFDISVWDKEYLVTVFDKVVQSDCASSYELSVSSESLDCS